MPNCAQNSSSSSSPAYGHGEEGPPRVVSADYFLAKRKCRYVNGVRMPDFLNYFWNELRDDTEQGIGEVMSQLLRGPSKTGPSGAKAKS